jgi:hypothetical protein
MGKIIWQNKKYQTGQPGITGVAVGSNPSTIVATVGSGEYQFVFNGVKVFTHTYASHTLTLTLTRSTVCW